MKRREYYTEFRKMARCIMGPMIVNIVSQKTDVSGSRFWGPTCRKHNVRCLWARWSYKMLRRKPKWIFTIPRSPEWVDSWSSRTIGKRNRMVRKTGARMKEKIARNIDDFSHVDSQKEHPNSKYTHSSCKRAHVKLEHEWSNQVAWKWRSLAYLFTTDGGNVRTHTPMP